MVNLYICSLLTEITSLPSHWYETVNEYSLSDLVNVSYSVFFKVNICYWYVILAHETA